MSAFSTIFVKSNRALGLLNTAIKLVYSPLLPARRHSIFISFIPCAFFVLTSMLLAQTRTNPAALSPAVANTANDKGVLNAKNALSGSEIDWDSFTNFGVYRLGDVQEEVQKRLKLDADFQMVITELIKEKNQGVIDRLKPLLGEDYQNSTDYDLLANLLSTAFDVETAEQARGITATRVGRDASLAGLLLNYAAVVNYYEKETGRIVAQTGEKEVESMVELFGDVEISIGVNTVRANYVLLNLTSGEVYAEDEVSLKNLDNFFVGERFVYDLKSQQGYVLEPSGILEGQFFRGKIITINRTNYYTLRDGWITFSKTSDPFYTMASSQIDSFGQDKIMTLNTRIRVGENNFFWFPYYIAYPLTTGVKMQFGENRRHGFYSRNSITFSPPEAGAVDVEFNIYEKLGIYFQIENSASFDWTSYSALLALAVYTENKNVQRSPRKLLYTHQTDSYINSPSFFRHKFELEQKFFLDKTEVLFGVSAGTSAKANVSQVLQTKIKNTSDPFITDNFRGKFSHLDWQKIIERHDRDESLYRERISDLDFYSLSYLLSMPGLSFSTSFSWKYAVYADPSKDEEDPIDERYKSYLLSTEIPNLSFRYSNFFDRVENTGNRAFYLNLGYTVYLNYRNGNAFKDGEPREIEGIDRLIEPFALLREEESFATGFEIFRSFTMGNETDDTIGISPSWLTWSFSPRFSFSYSRSRVPIENTLSDNLKDDRDDLRMVFSLGNTFGLGMKEATFVSTSLQQSFSLNDSRTEYLLTPSEKIANPNFMLNALKLSYDLSASWNFYIPSPMLQKEWAESYDYTAMLPTAKLSILYGEGRYTSNEKALDEQTKFQLDRFRNRKLSASFAFQQQGYGLFYVPMLDYAFSSSLGFSYDLMPVEDDNDGYVATNFFRDMQEFWRKDRVKSFEGSSNLNFFYRFFSQKNSLGYSFFETTTGEFEAKLKNYRFNIALNYLRDSEQKLNPWFSFNRFRFSFDWNYNFQKEDYGNDSMQFSMGLDFLVLKYTSFSMSVSAKNSDAERYFAQKSDYLGYEQKVDFFQDIVDSMGFAGREKQRQGLFKFSGFAMSIRHDLDDWFARLSYVLTPINFAEDSFRGYYLDHKVEFEVNLKPSRDPRGAGSTPLFETNSESFSPTL